MELNVTIIIAGCIIVILMMFLALVREIFRDHQFRSFHAPRLLSNDGIGYIDYNDIGLGVLLNDQTLDAMSGLKDESSILANPIGKRFSKTWSTKKLRNEKHIILFLGAESDPTNPISVEQDGESIKNIMAGSEVFHVVEKYDVKKEDVIPLITQYKPSIVHFDGHGTMTGNLAVCSDKSTLAVISPEDLKGVFNVAKGYVRLCYFDACYTDEHAKNATLSIDAAIGMAGSVPIKDAKIFARQFYLGLENDHSVQQAFELAKSQLAMVGCSSNNIPCLESSVGVDANTIMFSTKSKKGI